MTRLTCKRLDEDVGHVEGRDLRQKVAQLHQRVVRVLEDGVVRVETRGQEEDQEVVVQQEAVQPPEDHVVRLRHQPDLGGTHVAILAKVQQILYIGVGTEEPNTSQVRGRGKEG